MAKPFGLNNSITTSMHGPPGIVVSSYNGVTAQGKPPALVGDFVTPHGNFYDPKRKGFNPLCACAVVVEGIPGVYIGSKQVAPYNAKLSCGMHKLGFDGTSSIRAGK